LLRRARLSPPTLHNEQSSCRGIASLGALSHLPEGYGRALPLLDSTWQVDLLMTSNPIIEHGEHSSRVSLQFALSSLRGQCSEITAQSPSVSSETIEVVGGQRTLVLQTPGIL